MMFSRRSPHHFTGYRVCSYVAVGSQPDTPYTRSGPFRTKRSHYSSGRISLTAPANPHTVHQISAFVISVRARRVGPFAGGELSHNLPQSRPRGHIRKGR